MWSVLRPLVAVAIVCCCAMPLAAQSEIELPPLEDLLERHYQAIGGVEAWAAVKTVRIEGTVSGMRRLDSAFARAHERPSRFREEMAYRESSTIRGFDGKRAWQVLPMANRRVVDVPASQMASHLVVADPAGLLLDWEAKGYRLSLLGPEVDEAGDALYRIEVALGGEAKAAVLLGAEDALVRRVEFDHPSRMQAEGPMVVVFSGYRHVDGVLMPETVETRAPGLPQPIVKRAEKIAINETLPPGLFSPSPTPEE